MFVAFWDLLQLISPQKIQANNWDETDVPDID